MVTSECTFTAERLRKSLQNLQYQLSIAHAGAVVVTCFLKEQDAEQDWDVALVVERCIGECLLRQIAEADELIGAIDASDADAPECPSAPLTCGRMQ